MPPSGVPPSRSTDRPDKAFEGQPAAEDACGEAFFDALFDRTHAWDPAADRV